MSELEKLQTDPCGRRWIFVPSDQITDAMGPLSREDPRTLGIVLVENLWKAARRPYHKQKLAIIGSNQRHFALEQAARGVAVRYVVADGLYRKALEPLIPQLGTLRLMAPAERELAADAQPMVKKGSLIVIPNEGWLTTHEQFQAADRKGPPWRMDTFYRHIRREMGILMRNGKLKAANTVMIQRTGSRGEVNPNHRHRQLFRGTPSRRKLSALYRKSLHTIPALLISMLFPGLVKMPRHCGSGPKASVCNGLGPMRMPCLFIRGACFIPAFLLC